MFRRILKVLRVIAILLVIALVPLALAISYDSACAPAPPAPAGTTAMKAIMQRCYGPAEVLTLEDIERPTPGDEEVLVKVHAAAVNPLDWHYLHGTPYVMRFSSGFGTPELPRMGVDYAGTVELVGRNVTRFKPGDAVFGARTGAFAEYVIVRQDRSIVPKPANVTFEEAASVPVAAITALQALRDTGHLKAGEKVLINGASGGVGTYAVQIAKSMGAEVTGVCSTRNVEMVRGLGADHVIDYTQENFTEGAQRYDMIVDMVGSQGLLAYRRVLTPEGRLVIVGGKDGKWLGPLSAPLKAVLLSPFVSQEMGMMLANTNQQDLTILADLLASGKMKSVIDRTYPLAETPAALRYLEEGHARGKVVIAIAAQP